MSFAAAVSVLACVVVTVYSSEAAEAVTYGMKMCFTSVIPSLFPMVFISQYLVRSGGAEIAGSLLERPARFLLGLPGSCGVAMLTSFIGGYPAGAKCASTLCERGVISRRQAARLADIAFCPGPGFAIGLIGAQIYKNKLIGLLILTAQISSCIILGTALHIADGSRGRKEHGFSSAPAEETTASDAFVSSAADTASTMLNMCGFIILFQVIISMLRVSGVNSLLCGAFGRYGGYILPCLTEVTSGSIRSAELGLPVTAFVVGFGGLSVQFQNFAIIRASGTARLRYFLTRIVQGLLCSGIVALMLRTPVFSRAAAEASIVMSDGLHSEFSGVSVSFGCTMLVMCVMSVICLPQKNREL